MLNRKLAQCQFSATIYYNLETRIATEFKCEEDALDKSFFCIFHDENYLQEKNNSKEHEQKVNKELMDKISKSITQKKALLCIGYRLPDNTTIRGDFTKPVYFSHAKFQQVDFSYVKFSGKANFYLAKFVEEADYICNKK